MPVVNYICSGAPNLQLRIQDDPEIVLQFSEKILKLDEANDDDRYKMVILDRLIDTKPNISQLIKKSSLAEAHQMVRQHRANQLVQNGAVKGGMTADHINSLKSQDAQDALLAKLMADGSSEESARKIIAELADENSLTLPVKATEPVVDNMDGVTLDANETARRQAASANNAPVAGPRPAQPPATRQLSGQRPPVKLNMSGGRVTGTKQG